MQKFAAPRKIVTVLALLAVVAVAACSTGPNVQYPRSITTYFHPEPQVTSIQEAHALAQGSGRAGLAAGELNKLSGYVRAYISSGSGNFTIVVPEGKNRAAAQSQAKALGRFVAGQGLRAEEIDLRIAAIDSAKGPIVVSYRLYEATPPQCGKHLANPSYNPDAYGHPDYGCSTRNNIIHMVSNPADLVRGQTPPRMEGFKSTHRIPQYRGN